MKQMTRMAVRGRPTPPHGTADTDVGPPIPATRRRPPTPQRRSTPQRTRTGVPPTTPPHSGHGRRPFFRLKFPTAIS